VDLPVVEGGPAAYFSTLPVRAMVGRMRAAGVPAQVSYSAGTFLCNHLMYQVLHQMEEQEMKALAGFIHIPPLPEQVVSGGQGSMPVELVREGVLVGLEVVVEALDR
ncbi:MAG: pyroglutamyl-peptidase I, partial [bacterium]|nr:pyroglutamyl-peptidase I [bacterium]